MEKLPRLNRLYRCIKLDYYDFFIKSISNVFKVGTMAYYDIVIFLCNK